jgi:Flp pilus assembly protein TadD
LALDSSRRRVDDDPYNETDSYNRANLALNSPPVLETRGREPNVKPAKTTRRALFALLLASSTAMSSTGCSSSGLSVASLNPFSKATPSIGEAGQKPGITQSIAAGASGATDSMKSAGMAAKGFFGKTSSAVAGVFGRETDLSNAEPEMSDPLRLENRPDSVDPEVFVANGQLWESTGDMGKAMESYTKALETNPKHAPALTSLARLHFRQGKLPQAVDYFQKALAQNPQDAGLHNDLGLTLSKMGRQPEAIASLQKALQLAPGTSRYANNLASVRFENGDSKGALLVLTQNNKPAVAHFNMAYLHFKKGQSNQAQTHLSEALKFESQAATDPATGRAVTRSREMLAQIQNGGPTGTTTPAITMPPSKMPTNGLPGMKAPGVSGPAYAFGVSPAVTSPNAVQQTGQTGSANSAVAKAASMGPAMSAIGLPPQVTTPAPPTSTGATSTGATSAIAASSDATSGIGKTASNPTASKQATPSFGIRRPLRTDGIRGTLRWATPKPKPNRMAKKNPARKPRAIPRSLPMPSRCPKVLHCQPISKSADK